MTGVAVRWPWLADAAADCVVVGSGFGGAVSAARLSAHPRAGSVVLLERGREALPGSFPRDVKGIVAQLRTPGQPLGLAELVVGVDTSVFLSATLGGGSVFYAGVLLEPRPVVFESGWPAGLDLATLRPYYAQARAILAAETYRGDPLAKADALRQAAEGLGERAAFGPVPLGINLTRFDGENEFGAVQRPCTLCGNCCLGCNVGAKNTLGHNYLRIAHGNGATIVTGVEVTHLERSTRDGYRWRVHAVRHELRRGEPHEQAVTLDSRTVVLGAGALGTVGILQRSGDLDLSAQLGRRFSGNADTYFVTQGGHTPPAIAGVDDDAPVHPVGPVITAAVDLRDRYGLMLQDGALPAAFAGAIHAAAVLHRRGDSAQRSQLWLLMGYDRADGELRPPHGRGAARPHWPRLDEDPMWPAANRIAESTAVAVGGALVRHPRADAGGVIVHPLGGAAMADDVDHGVTDAAGRVFDSEGGRHPGLVVADGALVPTSLGANPALTIAALAEHHAAGTLADHLAAAS